MSTSDMETSPKTYISDSLEIAAHIERLVHRRIRGDLSILDDGKAVRVIFLGHGGKDDGSYVLLERLIALGSLSRLDAGRDVSVEYISDGISFSFESRSIDIEERDGCIRLKFPSKIIKSERRRFFRARPSQPFEVIVCTEDLSAKCPVGDISAGGLSFLTGLDNDRLMPGMELKGLKFTISDGYAVKVDGILRFHIPLDESSENKNYRCGVEFVGISESVQDRIVRHVFNLQKEEIKRRREDK